MRAAIYARVSTTDQHDEIQICEWTEYVARRGWDLPGVYQDTMSGAKGVAAWARRAHGRGAGAAH